MISQILAQLRKHIFNKLSTCQTNGNTQIHTAPLLITQNFFYTFITASNKRAPPLKSCTTPLVMHLKVLVKISYPTPPKEKMFIFHDQNHTFLHANRFQFGARQPIISGARIQLLKNTSQRTHKILYVHSESQKKLTSDKN